MDPTCFAGPSRVRAFVVPVSCENEETLAKRVEDLERASRVPLIDVQLPPNQPVSAGLLDPSVNPTGFVTYSFETKPLPAPQLVLLDLEPYRRDLLVLGLVESTSATSEECAEQLNDLRKKYPNKVYYALLVFNEGTTELGPNVFRVKPSEWTSLETTLSLLTAHFMQGLAEFWAARQLASFQSPLELLPGPKSAEPVKQGHPVRHGHTRNNLSLGRHGSISMTSADRAKARQNARSQKFFGDLLLLCGNHQAALNELSTAAHRLQQANDRLWLGSALSSIAVCLVLLRISGSPCRPPPVAVHSAWTAALKLMKSKREILEAHVELPGGQQKAPSVHSDLASHPLKKSRPFTEQTPVEEMLEYIIAAALDEMAAGEGTELVPYTVYYELVTRYSGLLINLNHYDWLKAVGGVSTELSTSESKHLVPSKFIDSWISRVYDLSTDLSPDTQAKILTTVSKLYAAAGMRRKWAFVCTQIISLLATSSATVDADLSEVHSVLEVYSRWPTLEAQILHKLVALGHRVKSPQLQTAAASQLLSMASPAVSASEQLTLYHLIRNFGDIVQSPFWDPKIVVNANVRALKLTTVPPPISKSEGIIYNPFEGIETHEECSVEAGVPTKARVWLRNPLLVDIQVYQLALVNGETLVSESIKDFVVPAQSTQFRLDVTVTPGEGTLLEATGVLVQVGGCAAHVCVLDTPISIPIVQPRPLLALQELSLLKGCAMLLEGERRKFTVTLYNNSQTSCHVVHFGYNETLPSNHAKKELSRVEMYEHEYYTQRCKAVELVEPKSVGIEPFRGEQYGFVLQGKLGVSQASILVDYGHQEDKLRRIKIPLQLTVHRSVWIERCTVLTQAQKQIMLIIDLRNGWRHSIRCRIWAVKDEIPEFTVVEPYGAHRMMLTLPWTPPEDPHRPIPVSQKQFTVDRQTSAEQLERFWLREHLLSMLDSEWELEGRSGKIELRRIELRSGAFDVLRRVDVEVTAPPNIEVAMDEQAELGVTIANNSDQQVQGMLRLAPNKAAQKFMLSIGCAQQLVTVPPSKSVYVKFKMLFVSNGVFEVAALLDLPTKTVYQTSKTDVRVGSI